MVILAAVVGESISCANDHHFDVLTQGGHLVIRTYCFIHLDNYSDKHRLLLQMVSKLYAFLGRQVSTAHLNPFH